MIRVESVGSVWLIDEDRQQYMRMPKTEGPRPDPDVAAELADLVWLPFVEWQFGKRDVWPRARRHWSEVEWLQILTPTGGWLYAPVGLPD